MLQLVKANTHLWPGNYYFTLNFYLLSNKIYNIFLTTIPYLSTGELNHFFLLQDYPRGGSPIILCDSTKYEYENSWLHIHETKERWPCSAARIEQCHGASSQEIENSKRDFIIMIQNKTWIQD